MSARSLTLRWMRLIQAEQRNARVCAWWDLYVRGLRTPRVERMRWINRACNRTELACNRAVLGR